MTEENVSAGKTEKKTKLAYAEEKAAKPNVSDMPESASVRKNAAEKRDVKKWY